MLQDALNGLLTRREELSAQTAELRSRADEASASARNACTEAIAARESAESLRRDSLLSASGTLGEAIDGIHSACEELRSSSQAAGKGAQDQQELIGRAVEVMDRLDAAVSQMLERSDRAVEQAETAQKKAGEGSETVERTVEAIRSVEGETRDLAAAVSELGGEAQAVEKIMEVISDIADQTNLLALNAAIEAARAGDAGRGFAVVADEVRKLAEKTMNATREVAQRINGIRQGVHRTEKNMGETADRVEAAVKFAQSSGESLGEIVKLSGGTAEHIHGIAEAAREHAKTSGDISTLVRKVSGISEESYKGSQGAVDSVAALMGRVDRLEAMNAVFRLVGGGGLQQMVEKLAADRRISSMERGGQEAALRDALMRNPSFELAYITDARGRQVVSNIGRGPDGLFADGSVFGHDWSTRPWFQQPAKTRSMAVSEVYVSTATGANCITVSTPLQNADGELLGVLAVDVSLGRDTDVN